MRNHRLNDKSLPLGASSPSSSSPMALRKSNRINLNTSYGSDSPLRQQVTPLRKRVDTSNVVGSAGPLSSSPFMPQIKRALGLEPNLQHKYRETRRHSLNLNMTTSSVTSPSLPHVKLNKTKRLSLTEKNSSMLRRSSTVKIAPPVIGKVASPSLYHLRCNTSTIENRSTPDTYAVISALKDRRKRSVNLMEETTDVNTQQAKRRRQESQHSNASTSSMPSMPEHFPDLTANDFSTRLETPGIKRPSRPSQADNDEWNQTEDINRQKSLNKNNSILSSLSSSQRFLQNQKRKADSSFIQKEDTTGCSIKSQRNEPPRLTHLDVSYENNDRSISEAVTTTTKNSDTVTTKSLPSPSTDKQNVSVENGTTTTTPTVTRLPCMKKTPSIYSGLTSPARFKKVQYANVIATLEDYDIDREVEEQRVKQMLKDLDESFNKKQEKEEETKKSESSVTMPTPVSAVTSSVTLVTTVSKTATSTSSVLSTLEKLSKSPIQEIGGTRNVAGSSISTTQSSDTVKLGLTQPGTSLLSGSSNPLSVSSTVTTPSTVSASLAAPAGFTFNTNPSSTQTLSGLLANTSSSVTPAASTGVAATDPNKKFGGFNFSPASSAPVASTPNVTGLSTPVSSSTAPGGFTFGSSGVAASTTSATPGFSFSSSSVTPSVPVPSGVSGFSFGAPTTSANASLSTGVSGFTFGTSTNSLGATSSTPSATSALSTPGFSGPVFTQAAMAPSGNFSFGANTGVSSSSAQPASQTLSTPGFSFGSGSTSAGFSNTTVTSTAQGNTTAGSSAPTINFGIVGNSSASQAPFTFNTGTASNTSASSSSAIGTFQFGVSSNATPTFGASTTSSSSAKPPSGFSFNTNPNTTAASAGQTSGLFGSVSQTPAFGSTNQTPAFGSASQPPAFGSSNQAPAFGSSNPTPAFGSANQAAPPAFGSTNQTSVFGSANQSAPPAYGSTSQAPAFGSTNQTVAPAFGSTNQAPAFGLSNPAPAFGSTNPAPAFGSTNQTAAPAFGSSNQAPAFGSANQAPAFGSNNPAPAFGSTNQTAAPTFGSTNPAPAFGSGNPPPAFGSTNQTSKNSNTPVFGASTNNAGSSVFGSTSSGTTGFGKSHSMPAFGTSNTDTSNNASTFSFGGTAPNVNPFGQGQVTPAKQTGSAFGAISTNTPKAQTGALFQFGQSNANSSAVKGFDFSNSSGAASNAGGFNFTASSSVPVFNFGSTGTPTATPNFGAPGSTPGPGGFSLGASDTAPRPNRARVRGRRQPRK